MCIAGLNNNNRPRFVPFYIISRSIWKLVQEFYSNAFSRPRASTTKGDDMLRKFCEHNYGELVSCFGFIVLLNMWNSFLWKHNLHNCVETIFITSCKFAPCPENTVVTNLDERKKKEKHSIAPNQHRNNATARRTKCKGSETDALAIPKLVARMWFAPHGGHPLAWQCFEDAHLHRCHHHQHRPQATTPVRQSQHCYETSPWSNFEARQQIKPFPTSQFDVHSSLAAGYWLVIVGHSLIWTACFLWKELAGSIWMLIPVGGLHLRFLSSLYQALWTWFNGF